MSSSNHNVQPLRVKANRSACCGYGVCADICPQVFALDDNGIVTVINELVPANMNTAAREAVAACPQGALMVIED